MPITPLPAPPSRLDPTNFVERSDAFMTALPVFATEAESARLEVVAKAAAAAASATTATTQAALATTNGAAQVQLATTQALAAAGSAGVAGAVAWVSGTTYAVGDARYSLENLQTYRRKVAGAGATDPSADLTNWTPAVDAGSSLRRSARTSNTVLGLTDKGKLVDIASGTFTQTFAAATTLADGWYCYLKNSGTGDITLDPNAAELIDGLASYVMYPGEVRLVLCDGTALRSLVVNAFCRTFTTSGTFYKPPGYPFFKRKLLGGGSGGSGGGGGGGGSSNYQYSGGGGGGGGGGQCGELAESVIISSLLPATVPIAIGSGGSPGTGGSGGTGPYVAGTTGGTSGAGGQTVFGTSASEAHYLAASGGLGCPGGVGGGIGDASSTGTRAGGSVGTTSSLISPLGVVRSEKTGNAGGTGAAGQANNGTGGAGGAGGLGSVSAQAISATTTGGSSGSGGGNGYAGNPGGAASGTASIGQGGAGGGGGGGGNSSGSVGYAGGAGNGGVAGGSGFAEISGVL